MNPSLTPQWGIYIHVPWCRRRCIYCDFHFEVAKPRPDFVVNLEKEWRARRSQMPSIPAATLFLGGGTPSALGAGPVQEIIAGLKKDKLLAGDAEISLEANPEDISQNLVEGWLQAGVNRLSLGIQSLQDPILHYLGRKHRRKEALRALKIIANSDLTRVSADLIIGVPGLETEVLLEDAALLLENNITHLSPYMLTVEPGSNLPNAIEKKQRLAPNDDLQSDHYEALQVFLVQQGLNQYEVSNFARKGFESVHNRLYWGKGPYLGLGPSAHSLIKHPDGSVTRRMNVKNNTLWSLNPANSIGFKETLSPKEAFLECVAFGLRDRVSGINPAVLSKNYGVLGLGNLLDLFEDLIKKGYLEHKNQCYSLTIKGCLFADYVARETLAVQVGAS